MADTPATNLLVRQDIWELETADPNDAWDPYTLAYAKAVREMMNRDPDDPTSWVYQSAMHGTYSDEDKPDWNNCQHASWFFLPWHRMYILAFEQIIRSIVTTTDAGPDDWALPFWDWTKNRSLPPAFRQPQMPDGSPNPLFTDRRNPSPSPGINGGAQLPAAVTATDYAFSFRFFATGARQNPLGGGLDTGFGGGPSQPTQFGPAHGALEDQPHNIIHDLVGGPAAGACQEGLMSDPFCAASDPIFWLHHSNIDRLWVNWLLLGGTRQNPQDSPWLTQTFDFFGPDRNPESWQVADVRSTPPLGYRYVTDPPPVAQPLPVSDGAAAGADAGGGGGGGGAGDGAPDVPELGSTTDVVVGPQPSSVEVPIASDGRDAVESAGGENPYEAPAVYLLVEDMAVDKHPGIVYSLYLNLPDADEQTGHYNEYFAGFLSFFGVAIGSNGDGGHDHGPPARKYDVTGLVARQRDIGAWDSEKATVTFVPTALEPAEGYDETPESYGYEGTAHEANARLGRVKLVYGS
jgi:tyrosinase